jgi:hypothetical protein
MRRISDFELWECLGIWVIQGGIKFMGRLRPASNHARLSYAANR